MTPPPSPAPVRLAEFNNDWYVPGGTRLRRALWFYVNAVLLNSALVPGYRIKLVVLRWFGAEVGDGVVIKPRVTIKYPWRLRIGDDSWIGEGVVIDNLGDVTIGANVCVSQEAYLLTGNHDYKDPRFGLVIGEIRIEDGAWVGARATVCPGVTMARGSVLAVGGVLTKDSQPFGIYAGNPATFKRERVIAERPGA